VAAATKDSGRYGEAQLSQLERPRGEAKRRLETVEDLLRRLSDAFQRLGCRIGHRNL
jgi:hypothetical protein